MPTPLLMLFRGLPGSGKSTLAATTGLPVVAADDYFEDPDGIYRFDPTLLPQAHAACQEKAKAMLLQPPYGVAVTNTFSQRWEIEPYVQIAKAAGARLVVVDLFDGGRTNAALAARNVHGVPVKTIRAMRDSWEHDWRAADPRPPWER